MNTQLTLAAARQFVDRCLRTDDSLFTPSRKIWTQETLADLYQRFVEHPDESSDSFEKKLERQLAEAPDETIQLAGECLYFYFLAPARTTHATKLRGVQNVLGWAEEPVEVPDDLKEALDGGIAGCGTAYNTFRPFLLQYILKLATELKELPEKERSAILDDPWKLREKAYEIDVKAAGSMREALLHLVHPGTFEPIVSGPMKERIAEAFADRVADPSGKSLDRRLLEIRRSLEEEHGPGWQFYDQPFLDIWQPESSLWGRFVHWAKRFVAEERFAPDEYEYKLEIAHNLRRAKEAFLARKEGWQGLLRKAFGSPNNLTFHIDHSKLLDWVEKGGEAHEALGRIWNTGLGLEERIRGFCELLPPAISGRASRTTLAVFLNLANDPERQPPLQWTPFKNAFELTGHPQPGKELDEAELYRYALDFLDTFNQKAEERGLALRDRLEAQGAVWAVVRSTPEHWRAKDRKALEAFREGLEIEPDHGGVEPGEPPADLGELAENLFLTEEFLRRIERLLQDRRQVIFYGPPGTGKTFVARHLARHFAENDSTAVKLVQFHPSYGYEDFIEGYRPARSGEGSFILRDGPLKQIAAAATSRPEVTHVLVIDEINRANVAKVFGELYFLLEYRKQDLELQYSASKFSLPDNLWIIGTMNTADRSIALVDAALRRRFHFVGFYPDRPPIDGLLRGWLGKHREEMLWVADVLERANALLDDRDLAIGPSHFMKEDLDEEWVRIVWEHSVLPYLAEQFFDEPGRLEDLSLEALRRPLGGEATALEAEPGPAEAGEEPGG